MNSFNYLVLWLLYLSHFSGGDRFMHFQWDLLLLETGFLAIFFAPTWYTYLYEVSPTDSLARELIRFLALRLMFGGGFVKLLSRCKTWWSFTALHYHFETQPLPHFLSWYQHNLTSDIMKRYGVVVAFLIELVLPWFFYSPFRDHRIIAALANQFIMLVIFSSGNYCFFNLLTCLVCMIVMDDEFLIKWVPNWLFRAMGIKIPMTSIIGEMK
jgi:Lipase maturation factor